MRVHSLGGRPAQEEGMGREPQRHYLEEHKVNNIDFKAYVDVGWGGSGARVPES